MAFAYGLSATVPGMLEAQTSQRAADYKQALEEQQRQQTAQQEALFPLRQQELKARIAHTNALSRYYGGLGGGGELSPALIALGYGQGRQPGGTPVPATTPSDVWTPQQLAAWPTEAPQSPPPGLSSTVPPPEASFNSRFTGAPEVGGFQGIMATPLSPPGAALSSAVPGTGAVGVPPAAPAAGPEPPVPGPAPQTQQEALDKLYALPSFQRMNATQREREVRLVKARIPLARGATNYNPEEILPPETIRRMAEQALAGDTSVLRNPGRGVAGRINMARLRTEVTQLATERGMSGAEVAQKGLEYAGSKVEQQTIARNFANIRNAAQEFNRMLPLALEASAAVNRTSYPFLNKIVLAGREQRGDSNVVAFGTSIISLINSYTRAINPRGQPTVYDKQHAADLLNKSWSTGQFQAATSMMQREIDAALHAPPDLREQMHKEFIKRNSFGEALPSVASTPGGAPAPSGPTAIAPNGHRVMWNGQKWIDPITGKEPGPGPQSSISVPSAGVQTVAMQGKGLDRPMFEAGTRGLGGYGGGGPRVTAPNYAIERMQLNANTSPEFQRNLRAGIKPQQRTMAEDIRTRTKGMSEADVLGSEPFWAHARTLAASKGKSITWGLDAMAQRVLGRSLTQNEMQKMLLDAMRTGILSGPEL
jgi:hypothetical protein